MLHVEENSVQGGDTMQRFEVTHWWETYAVNIDEHNGTIEFVLPDGTRTYKMEDLGAVWSDCVSNVINHGNQTDNIIQGAAIGGKTGAFVAAFSPSGTSVHTTKRWFIVCRKWKGQNYFRYPDYYYKDDHKELIYIPSHRKFGQFSHDVVFACNQAIRDWHKTHDKKEEK